MTGKRQVLLLGAFIILGTLLGREFPMAGLIVTLFALGLYLLAHSRKTIRNAVRFRQSNLSNQILVLTYGILLFILIRATFTTEIPYFLLLVMLGIDFLIYEKKAKK